MGIPLYQVDAFTDKLFSGNPAAVCILTAAAEDRWMQQVAAEMNLSETAFVRVRQDGCDLRWFTPLVEVELCGHATLAAAHILWSEGYLAAEQPAKFLTKSGWLTARVVDGWIELDFPAEPPQAADPPPGLLEALGVQAKYIGRNRLDYLVEVETAEIVRDLCPDFAALARAIPSGVIVTSKTDDPSCDFVSRYFDPGEGIAEDPVTGSAHCCLGPYWQAKLGKQEFTAFQASSRGGTLQVRVDHDRVYLRGRAVTVWKGTLLAHC